MTSLINWISTEDYHQFQQEKTTAHRLYSSDQGWIERWNEEIVISYYENSFLEYIVPALHIWLRANHFNYKRVWGRELTQKETQKNAPYLLEGPQPSSFQFVVQEKGVLFKIDFQSGYSLGLFLDQRQNRDFVRHHPAPRLLNCFCYTGSFSVMAALQGGQTLNIDLSQKTLERAKENFTLNGLALSAHRFWARDVRLALPQLQKKAETFDIIILDPPTFSRGEKGRPFRVEQDLKKLITDALALLCSQGKLLVSTNCTRLSKAALRQICYSAIGSRSIRFHEEPALPDIPQEFAAKTLWLLV